MTLNLQFYDVNSDNALGNLIGLMIEYFRVLLIFKIWSCFTTFVVIEISSPRYNGRYQLLFLFMRLNLSNKSRNYNRNERLRRLNMIE